MGNETLKKGEKKDRNPDGTFKKGEWKGGPGYPKGRKNFTTKVREAMAEIADGDADEAQLKLGRKIYEMALDGDRKMIQLIWNYFDGKPPQSMDLTSGGKELNRNPYEDLSPEAKQKLADIYNEELKKEMTQNPPK